MVLNRTQRDCVEILVIRNRVDGRGSKSARLIVALGQLLLDESFLDLSLVMETLRSRFGVTCTREELDDAVHELRKANAGER